MHAGQSFGMALIHACIYADLWALPCLSPLSGQHHTSSALVVLHLGRHFQFLLTIPVAPAAMPHISIPAASDLLHKYNGP